MASSNTIAVNANDITDNVYGGFVSIDKKDATDGEFTADSNALNIIKNGTNSATCDVFGGYAAAGSGHGSASGNVLSMSKGGFAEISAGCATMEIGAAKASYNGQGADKKKVSTLSNVKAESFRGGRAYTGEGSAEAKGNKFTIKNGSYGTIAGGSAEVKKKSHKNDSDSSIAVASGNELALYNVEVKKNVYGGESIINETGTAVATDNRLDIYGGSYKGNIYAGYGESVEIESYAGVATASNNTVLLRPYENKMPSFSETTEIWGGYASVRGIDTVRAKTKCNALEFHKVKGMTVANIHFFSKISFELPDMKAGETVITLTGGKRCSPTDLYGAVIDVQKIGSLKGSDGGEFKIGDRIYLLKNKYGLDAKGITGKAVSIRDGLFEYTFEVKTDKDENGDVTAVYLTRTEGASLCLLSKIKELFQ